MGPKQIGILAFSAIVLLGAHIVMELSRMYLGMHAANQVILGASMGTWTAGVGVFVLLPYFEAYNVHLRDAIDTDSLKSGSKILMIVMTSLAIGTIIMVAIMDSTIFQQYEIPSEYAANLATCRHQASFKYKASPFVLLLASYAMYPVGILFGLQFRWSTMRGWSLPLVDHYTSNKYYATKWAIKLVAGIFTLMIPFTYAILFGLIGLAAGRIPIPAALIFQWIPIVLLNGFIVSCGLHTFLTRYLLYKLGYPLTFGLNFLNKANMDSLIDEGKD